MNIRLNIHHHFQSFATQFLNPQRWLAAAKPKAVRLEVVAFSLLLLPVILVMADHLPFVDVPSNAFFHDAVSAVYGARITTGTTPTTFSPEDPVTRGQMAVFLHRGLGRVAESGFNGGVALTTSDADIAVLTINTGGAAGGIAFIKVDAALNVYTTIGTGCPCEIEYNISRVGQTDIPYRITILPSPGPTWSQESGAATASFIVPTATTQTFRLRARVINQDAPGEHLISGYGRLTAIAAPFGAFGDSTLSAATEGQDEAPPGTEPERDPDTER